MSEYDTRPEVPQEGILDLLVERVGAWYRKLVETRDNMEEVMSHPAAGIFLGNQEMISTSARYRARSTQPGAKSPDVLSDCVNQEEVCEYLAARNNGVADLVEATRLIRRLRLATTDNERTIRKNLNQYQGGMCISGVLKTTERGPRNLTLPSGTTGWPPAGRSGDMYISPWL